MNSTNPFSALTTPALLVDEEKMMTNIVRLRNRPVLSNVTLRPHLKTAKSIGITRRMLPESEGPATVSTLKEAEVFFEDGVKDILYAVGISPQKLPRVCALRKAGCDMSVLLDSPAQANAVVKETQTHNIPIPSFIEIDSDGRRGGVLPDDSTLLEIGHILDQEDGLLSGVLTHAGGSYGAVGREAHAEFAEQERNAAVSAAEQLRKAGLPCPNVSIGSTPTTHAIQNVEGVTEVRAGVYVFFDLVMAGIGACKVNDIALSVLTTVIGHQRSRGWILVDAGWMALSRDRGTANQAVDQGYGVVCDVDGNIMDDLIVKSVSQEHGIITLRENSTKVLPDLSIGTQLRILPNHACATASQFDTYSVIPKAKDKPLFEWSRFDGW